MRRSTRLIVSLVAVALLVSILAFAMGDPEQPMPGNVLILKHAKSAKFVSTGTFTLPTPADDPTVAGATLQIFDRAGTGIVVAYPLPPAGWKGLGNPPGSKGFKFRGPGGQAFDSCRLVFVKPNLVKATTCLPSPSTPFGGAARINLFVGMQPKVYCAEFGGTTVQNDGSRLIRRGAPAPSTCSPSGAFLDPSDF